jgi:hypothetical protein
MKNVAQFAESIIWGSVGLGVSLIVFFAIIHVLKTQAANVPVVGAPVAVGAQWVGAHAQNY